MIEISLNVRAAYRGYSGLIPESHISCKNRREFADARCSECAQKLDPGNGGAAILSIR
jgi:hypothetical protein